MKLIFFGFCLILLFLSSGCQEREVYPLMKREYLVIDGYYFMKLTIHNESYCAIEDGHRSFAIDCAFYDSAEKLIERKNNENGI